VPNEGLIRLIKNDGALLLFSEEKMLSKSSLLLEKADLTNEELSSDSVLLE